jgi:DNA mismatch endonuclease, patch repair protein
MRGNAGRNTRPELAVRKVLWKLGYRYRLHSRLLPGKPDICFARRRKVIFVHGCFWHQHKGERCPFRTRPASNVAYWRAKLHRNVQRDRANRAALRGLGWKCKIIWECEVNDTVRLENALQAFLGGQVQKSRAAAHAPRAACAQGSRVINI